MADLFSDFKSYAQKDVSSAERRRRDIIEMGRVNFRAYCNAMNPEFFKPEREYQDKICDILQAMYEKKLINPDTGKPYGILIINLPPGFGKSYTACLFATWVFGQSIKNQVITVSYMQDLAIDFSKAVRNAIQEEAIAGDDNDYAVTSFFPNLQIKRGDGAMDKWALEGNYMNYLGTSFNGKLTGMRANILIIDDPIKDAVAAVNDAEKLRQWVFYKNTFFSRKLAGAMQIIIQTRWATDDLAGMLESQFPERCYILKLPALDENGKSLCEDLYPTEDLLEKSVTIDEHIWSANFMQIPVDIKGALYGEFKTYAAVDADRFERVIAYIDTADEGSDFLCAIMGGVIGTLGYVTDIYYTDAPMEETEPETARKLADNGIRESLIESNNGGRGFARNVISGLQKLGAKAKKCCVTWFHQTKNKRTRILVNATNVMEQVVMPEDWEKRWPAFAKAIKTYQRKGKNAHDDAPDALTGFVELINGDVKGRKKARTRDRKAYGGRI